MSMDPQTVRDAVMAAIPDLASKNLNDALREAINAGVDEGENDEDEVDLGSKNDAGFGPSVWAGGKQAVATSGTPRIAKTIMKNILATSEYVRFFRFKKDRNHHEARRLAQVIDSARSAGMSFQLDFMEMLLRNLAGICEVDKYNNPGLLEKIEFAPPEELIPRDIFRAFTKDAKRDAEMRKAAAKTPKKPKNPPATAMAVPGDVRPVRPCGAGESLPSAQGRASFSVDLLVPQNGTAFQACAGQGKCHKLNDHFA